MNDDFDIRDDRALGEGALGTVHAGRQRSTGRDVTVTVLRRELSEDKKIAQRFRRDLELATRVEHPNIVRTLGGGTWKGRLFVAMEWIDAVPLSTRVPRENRLDAEDLWIVAEGCLEALIAAERGRLTPLHLRTGGLLLGRDLAVKVTDLGLSRIVDPRDDAHGFTRDTLAYCSPERLCDQVPDLRSDIFALGVVLYELATGRLPFDGHESPTSFVYQVLHSIPTPPIEVDPTIPRDLDRLIMRCLAKTPEDRFQKADELLEEIRALRRTSSISAPPEGAAPDFEIHEDQIIGEGGMGTLFRGHQKSLNREVAIKVIKARLTGNPDICARFHSEAELLAKVQDGHVVQVYGAGTWKGRAFYAMELVEGEDLSARLAKGPPPTLEEILAVAEGVGKALRAVWRYRIVHRDLKPANIFLERTGRVKVADFGLAASVRSHPAESRYIVGTLAYLSPEQGIGADVDVRSDIYSLGVVLFQLASGDLPFGCSESSTSVIWRHRFDPPPSLVELGKLPDFMDAIIRRCLAKRPAERFQTPEELIEAVHGARRRLSAESHPGTQGRRASDAKAPAS